MLDISIYSRSDSEHWFKYLTLLPDHPSETMPTTASDDAYMAGLLVLDTPPRLAGHSSKFSIGLWRKGHLRAMTQSLNGGISFRQSQW